MVREQMKPSGIDWIGDIPSAWDVKRIKYVIQNNADGIKVGPFGSALTNEVVGGEEGQYKIYGQANLIRKDFDYGDNYVTEENYRRLINYEVLPEDIAVSMMGTIGKCLVVPYGIKPGIMDSHLIKIRLSNKMLPRFFEYIYESCVVYDQLVVNSKGSIMNGLNSSIVKSVFLAVPSTDEQQVIADFLDAQCSKLDSIIADLEKQIDTLQKYKKSLITETVTKGLDKSVPMKDSGIEWAKQIPAHWQTTRMQEIGKYKKGPFGSAITIDMFVDKDETSIKVYEQKNAIQADATLGWYYISRMDFRSLTDFEVFPGDIIVSCAGTIGKCYIMPNTMERGIINQALMKITLFEGVDSDYFLYLFDVALEYMSDKYSNGSAIKNIPPFSVLKKQHIPLPKLEEQRRIALYIREKSELLDSMLLKKQQQLQIIQQHKKSLIYEYVTGKKRVTEVE